MGSRRVAPAAIVAGEVIVWRTEVCGGDGNGSAPQTPLGILSCVAHYLIAPPARLPVVEQSRAKSCSFYAITIGVEISISAGTV